MVSMTWKPLFAVPGTDNGKGSATSTGSIKMKSNNIEKRTSNGCMRKSTNSYSFPCFGKMMNGKMAMNRYIYTLFFLSASLLFGIVLWILPSAMRSLFFFSTLFCECWCFSTTLILSKSHVIKARTSEQTHSFSLHFFSLNGFFSPKNLMKVWIRNEIALCYV